MSLLFFHNDRKPSSKPVEGKSVEYFEDTKGNTVSKVVRPAHAEGEKDIRAETVRKLAGQVIKDKDAADPCHDGLSPRCTPPTSKPVEHSSKQAAALPRTLSAVPVKVTKDDADPCHDGLSPRCTPPTSKPVEHRKLAGSPTKSPSSGLHKPTWKPSSKPNEHRTLQTAAAASGKKLQPPEGVDAKHPEVPVAATEGVPTKSPSAGLHKPTWKPSSKPAEHAVENTKVITSSTQIHDGPKTVRPSHMEGEVDTGRGEPTVHRALSGYKAVGSPTKSPSTGIMKPTWKPSSKPQEDRKLTVRGKGKTEKPVEGPPAPHQPAPKGPRILTEVRGKVTPSSSSVRGSKGKTEKPVEGPPAPHAEPKGPRKLSAVPVTKDDADPCHDGLSPRCTPPTSKPVEHRSLAGSPTKSPSSGLHKPTWKPSSKPAENSKESETVVAEEIVVADEVVTTASSSSSSSSSTSSSSKAPNAEKSGGSDATTSRESGPKGATKKLAHDGAPSTTTTSTSTTRKLSSKSKDSRPTMTPRTDKPSDRVV